VQAAHGAKDAAVAGARAETAADAVASRAALTTVGESTV